MSRRVWLMAGWLALLASVPVTAAELDVDTSDELVVITVTGEIALGDDERFRALAVQHRRAAVVLASDGGNLDAALAIGRAIHVAGWSTAVPNGETCASACALIWLAGTPRYVGPNAAIGFHAAYRLDRGQVSESGVANAFVGRYLGVLNLPDRAVEFATTAGPEGMRWLDLTRPGAEGITFQLLPEAVGMPARRESYAQSGDGESDVWWDGGGWTVFQNDDGCSALVLFSSEGGQTNQSILSVSAYDAGTTILTIANERFRSLRDGEDYRMDLSFFADDDVDEGWGTVVGLANTANGLRTLSFKLERRDLLRDLARSSSLAFYHPRTTDRIDGFPLTGSADAVGQLRACLASRPAVLADPFAR